VRERAHIEAAILSLLSRRAAAASICPSEVARALGDDWRARMHDVREAAAALADAGHLRITRAGVEVPRRDLHHGAIRLSRGPRFDA
jgi:Protein of unknown function (DUF3253)